MPKTDRFELRLTQTEKQAVTAKAATWGLSLSEYVRVALTLHQPPKQVTDMAWKTFSRLGEVYGQLRRIGSTLNHISQAATSQGEVPESLSQELQRVDATLTELRQVLLDVRSQIDHDDTA